MSYYAMCALETTLGKDNKEICSVPTVEPISTPACTAPRIPFAYPLITNANGNKIKINSNDLNYHFYGCVREYYYAEDNLQSSSISSIHAASQPAIYGLNVFVPQS